MSQQCTLAAQKANVSWAASKEECLSNTVTCCHLRGIKGNEARMGQLGRQRKGVAEKCQSKRLRVDTIPERMDGHMEKRKQEIYCEVSEERESRLDLHPERVHGYESLKGACWFLSDCCMPCLGECFNSLLNHTRTAQTLKGFNP